ncbi:MAG: DUF1049 domain-containing protein [Anaerolineaceae bacterium]|nr:DUF1049 domain-containing protein [Anaerolineaceae bacterium]
MQFMIIFALIVSIFAVVFALQNPNIVTVQFFGWTFEQPLALFLLISIAIGALIISILTIPGWLKSRQMRSKHRKEVAELEDNLSKYRSNLIDAQNSNKDLRQKILEIEEAKEKLEQAQAKAQEEIRDLHEALNKADLSTQEAQQARKEAMDARDNINLALRELEIKLDATEESKDTYKGLLDKMSNAMPYALPGSGGEIDTLMEEAALDAMPTAMEQELAAKEAAPAEQLETAAEPEPVSEPEPAAEAPAEEKKKRFSFF